MSRAGAPPRVLHVVENLDRGAVEGWLVQMMRAARDLSEKIDWTFYCALGRPGRLDEEARALGARIVYSPVSVGQTTAFMAALRWELRQGRYDVLHCHHDVMSGLYLLGAVGIPIGQRIVHVHNADLGLPTPSRVKVALLHWPLRRLAIALSDRIVGISRHTLENFLAGRAPREQDRVLYYGIDLEGFRASPPRARMRGELSVPEDARILLYVGRLVPFKNPIFVMELLEALSKRGQNVYAAFAGTGPLENDLMAYARSRGLTDRARVLGWRDDARALMQISDVFVFPRLEARSEEAGIEGLGLVIVEAQAAGLPVLTTHGVPDDAVVSPEICRKLSLNDGVGAWADAAVALMAKPRMTREAALARVEASPFEPHRAFENLHRIHQVA